MHCLTTCCFWPVGLLLGSFGKVGKVKSQMNTKGKMQLKRVRWEMLWRLSRNAKQGAWGKGQVEVVSGQ